MRSDAEGSTHRSAQRLLALSRDEVAKRRVDCSCAELGGKLPTDVWHRECAADLPRELIRDLRVPRHRFNVTYRGIAPQGMRPAFAFEVTAMTAQVAQ